MVRRRPAPSAQEAFANFGTVSAIGSVRAETATGVTLVATPEAGLLPSFHGAGDTLRPSLPNGHLWTACELPQSATRLALALR